VDSKIFTQCVSLLLRSKVSLDQIAAKLPEYSITGRNEGGESWEFCGPALIIPFRDEVEGYVVIDVVDQDWPDDMGYSDQNSILFAAWKTGNFGVYSFPGSLERATEQSWAWPEGKSIALEHSGFIRIRTSYVLGDTENGDEELSLPEDYDPVDELEFLTDIAGELMALPQAVCYFNPSGEVIRDQETFVESTKLCEEHEVPTIDLWANVRLFRFDGDWAMMDSVGNGQLGLDDIEACFHTEGHDFNKVDGLIRMLSMLLFGGEEFEEGESVEDEEGESWHVSFHEDSLCDPPRQVLRLLPADGREVPAELQAGE